ncbi:cupin domain-containing protein [Streptomyces sp. NPDC048172]|uniref:cupin domain-containing protein n=1 Tax=Streptomyces sp. NPDC048172 TaxID=3365505 RepID=UPI0037101329
MRLGDLVRPSSAEEFLQRTLGVEPALFRGDEHRFESLVSWDVLSGLVSWSPPDGAQIRLNQDGKKIDESEWIHTHLSPDGRVFRTIRTREFRELLGKGATLVVDAVDRRHRPLDSLARGLERDFGTPVQINAYSAWGESPGFGMHWDGHDVLVLQVTGEKEWTLFGSPPRRWPMEQDLEEAPLPPDTAEGTVEILRPGDVLHVPRGWWHSVRAMDGPTLHLTIGIPRPTGVDLLQWLAGRMSAHPVFRADLPRHRTPEERERHRQDLVRTVSVVLEDPALVDDFLAAQDSGAPARRVQSLGGLAPDGGEWRKEDEVSWLAPRAVLREADDRIVIEADGHRFTFSAVAGDMLRLLTDELDTTVGEVLAAGTGGEARLDEGTVREFLADVVAAGLAAVTEPR